MLNNYYKVAYHVKQNSFSLVYKESYHVIKNKLIYQENFDVNVSTLQEQSIFLQKTITIPAIIIPCFTQEARLPAKIPLFFSLFYLQLESTAYSPSVLQ